MIRSLTVARFAVTFFLACLTLGCTAPGRKSIGPAKHAGQTTLWKRSFLSGLSVTLIDDRRVEYFSFASNGMVAVTYGSIRKKGNQTITSLCGPLDYWKLVDGILEIRDCDGKLYERLTLVSLDKEHLVVIRQDGTQATYKVHSNTNKN
ncbi:hypothetical protein [Prosthecobacter sp.]|jgi:hypothetical protein|uniref:hypothetical protein n=1 Tax=Prosthecobacter sp. TaxID=1965333 RepID=UPI0037C92CAC